MNEVTLDIVQNFLETNEEGQKWLQSYSDAKVTKGISTWKENNLQAEVDEKVKKLYPSEDPKDSEIKKLSMELEEMRKQTLMADLTNEALKTAADKKLPQDIVKMLVTSDRDKTNSNIQALEEVWNTTLKDHIKSNVNSTSPNFNDGGANGINIDRFNQMSYQEKKSLRQSNPDLYGELTK